MSSSDCCFLTCIIFYLILIYQKRNFAYRFLKRQVRWSGIPISFRIFQFIVIHTVKGFGIVNKAEIDVFLELSCFFHDPVDVSNLISGSSAFSKTSLNIWKFTVHALLKPGLESFKHYVTSLWDEWTCVVVWACLEQREGRTESWEFLIHTGSHGLQRIKDRILGNCYK